MPARSRGTKIKRGYRFTGVLLLAVALSFSWSYGCGRKTRVSATPTPASAKQTRPILYDRELRQVLIYYATSDLRYLVPVTVVINPTREVAKTAVEKLLAGPAEDSLARTMPEGVKLREVYSLSGEKIAYVDLTNEVLKVKDTKDAELAVRSLILTLTELQDIEGVRILIEGQVLPDLVGIKLDETFKRPPWINSLLKGQQQVTAVQVYFSDQNALHLIPVALAARTTKEEDLPRAALIALLTGPPADSGLLPTVWPGTSLRNFYIQDGIAFVDLSKEAIAYGGGSTAETIFINSLLWTLTQFPSINRVQLLIEGERKDYLPEGTPVKDPLPRPRYLNMIHK